MINRIILNLMAGLRPGSATKLKNKKFIYKNKRRTLRGLRTTTGLFGTT